MIIPTTLVHVTCADDAHIVDMSRRRVHEAARTIFNVCPNCKHEYFDRSYSEKSYTYHTCPICGHTTRTAYTMYLRYVLNRVDELREKVRSSFENLFPEAEPAYALAA